MDRDAIPREDIKGYYFQPRLTFGLWDFTPGPVALQGLVVVVVVYPSTKQYPQMLIYCTILLYGALTAP